MTTTDNLRPMAAEMARGLLEVMPGRSLEVYRGLACVGNDPATAAELKRLVIERIAEILG